MDIENNEYLENVSEITNESISEPVIVVNSTTQSKPSDQPAMISLVLGLIGSGISITTGATFLALLAIIIGFVLIGNLEYILLFSLAASVGIILGIISIILGAKSVKYYKAISIFGILSGAAATILGILDLLFFIYCHNM